MHSTGDVYVGYQQLVLVAGRWQIPQRAVGTPPRAGGAARLVTVAAPTGS